MREHEIHIERVPDWKSLEIGLTESGLPEIINEREVTRKTFGFSKGSSSSSSSQSSSSSTLPIVAGSSTTLIPANQHIDDFTTGQLIEQVSKETKEKSLKLSHEARESTKILDCIRTNPFMQYEEIEHFKKWVRYV